MRELLFFCPEKLHCPIPLETLSIFNSVVCGHTKAAADSCYGPLGSRSLSIFVSINPVGGRQARKGMSRIPCPEIWEDMYPKTASLAQFRNTTEFLITWLQNLSSSIWKLKIKRHYKINSVGLVVVFRKLNRKNGPFSSEFHEVNGSFTLWQVRTSEYLLFA